MTLLHLKLEQLFLQTYTHTHTHITWIHGFVIKTAGCGTSHKYINIQIYSIKIYKHFKKCYKSLHIKNSSTE